MVACRLPAVYPDAPKPGESRGLRSYRSMEKFPAKSDFSSDVDGSGSYVVSFYLT
jgi:hypothetical protein